MYIYTYRHIYVYLCVCVDEKNLFYIFYENSNVKTLNFYLKRDFFEIIYFSNIFLVT